MAPSLLESTHAVLSPAPILRSRANTTLKSRVASGETLYGLFLMSASPTIAEIAGLAGYDFVVVDMEHGPGGISEALSCIRALAAAGTPHVIRGIRGTAHVMVQASGYGTDDTYVHRCEEELLILCMVETETGVDNIEAIAAVDGVDGIQMGPRDLGASMGYLKDPGNPKAREVLLAAEKRVLAMQKAGRGPFLGGISTQQHKPEQLRERGYNMIAGGVDVGLFRQAAVEDVHKFRRGAAQPPLKNKNQKLADQIHVPSVA